VNGSHILIVDDDPALLEALSQALQLRVDGLTVDTSDSAHDALKSIAANNYDALVVDIKMPRMDGLELLSEIKKLQPDTPTLLITGHGDHELAVQALRSGAYDYVTKPIDREYFVTSLRRAIECHALSRDVAQKRLELAQRAEELEACVQERTLELRDALHREQAARAELDRAHKALEEMNQQREQFVSMIAHDLAQPLTALRGYAEVLGRPGTSQDMQARAHRLILSETNRLTRLVQDLADAAQLAAGLFGIRSLNCDLVQIARQQIELVEGRSDRHRIHLDAPETLPTTCDRDRLAQVLLNLLTNAINYTSGGDIQVRVWREEDQAHISVSDQGQGIPADQVETIFDAGQRLPEGDSSGTGLGLYITRGIVEAHGGQVWVDSADQGAVFHVTLPIVPVLAATEA
jgi:two-component system, sensor histidine kinase and response regulator